MMLYCNPPELLTAAFLTTAGLFMVQAGEPQSLYPESKPTSPIYSIDFNDFQEQYLSSLLVNLSQLLSSSYSPIEDVVKITDYPQKWDWREKSFVSPIKNQKECGGCWAFSTAETMESIYAKKYNSTSPVPELSVQEIIDCSAYNHGCKGGSACEALIWLNESSVPLVSDKYYPLTDDSQMCNIEDISKTSGVRLSNYKCFQPINNEQLLLAIIYQIGPVIAAVDATTWNEYMGGVIQYHCGAKLNHAVQIIGYDLTGEVPYYIVRNSWGSDWGHDGYAYIRAGSNTCGIAQAVNVVLDVTK